ncbi:MAG: hypothetical protein M0T84_00120 [Betaproteobacteria bacterium]|nr:hypothetical protein [Betaproteobacteria bacterium]
MKDNNPLDLHLEINKLNIPADVRDATIFVSDTLLIAWKSAQSIFGERASPEVALAIFDRIETRMHSQSSFSIAPQVHGT